MTRLVILPALLMLAACQPYRATGPFDAIQSAAAAAPRGVPGLFRMRVRGTGRQDGYVYLNSQPDYRDQRNLTIAIRPSAFATLTERLGAAPDVALGGKTIRVRGVARRVRIDFLDGARPTGKYYFQTHVDVANSDQIKIIG